MKATYMFARSYSVVLREEAVVFRRITRTRQLE